MNLQKFFYIVQLTSKFLDVVFVQWKPFTIQNKENSWSTIIIVFRISYS